MNYKEIAKETEKMIWKELERGYSEALGAVESGKKHHQELGMNQQRLNLVQKVEYECLKCFFVINFICLI